MLRLKLLLVFTLCFLSTVSPVKVPKIKDIVTNHIIGGHPADIKKVPYQVYFSIWEMFLCGGFIISENYILTAAHCVQYLDPLKLVLQAGSSLRPNGTIIHIAKVIIHPEYNHPTFDKDVAIMKTAEPIDLTSVIQPVKLPEKNRPLLANSLVTVSGWGKTKPETLSHKSQQLELLAVEIPVVPHEQCLEAYPNLLTGNMWCGGDYELGGVGACQGDSGGAAVQDGIAVGIVSFGRVCGERYAPAVFANIAAPDIRDFITEHTGV